jgi:FkbH-like protein
MQEHFLGYNKLVKLLKMQPTGLRNLRIAVLADSASQHFVKALKSALIPEKFDATIWEADYNAVDATIIHEHSELYQQSFDYVVIVYSVHKLYKEFSHFRDPSAFAGEKLNGYESLYRLLADRTRARLIVTNFEELNDGIFGNYANKTSSSFLYQVRKLNLGLMQLSSELSNLFITDVQSLYSSRGHAFAFDPKMYIHGDIAYSLDFIALLAQSTARIIGAIQGNIVKCVVLDLDNTLWGGIIGDDGIDNIQIGDLGIGKAYSSLQQWLLNLKNRGIILAVCSKNTESIAKEVFIKHPGMTLRMDDISVFVANWETKVDNIRFIQSVLNIGFDSMVFLDDNPFERDIVRQHVPGIIVPELPEDPSEYLFYLRDLNLFETASFTGEDNKRTKQYQEEAGRKQLQKTFTNEAEFLKSLEMKALVQPVDSFTCPRVAQLTQRSNQFNLRTVRYTDEDIKAIMVNGDYRTVTLSLSDKYGDYGLISAIIMRRISDDTFFIDTWIMSCRVLKRGVENLALNELVSIARESGCRFIVGEYLPTLKNGMVSNHYIGLGFEALSAPGSFQLDVTQYNDRNTFINKTGIYVNN